MESIICLTQVGWVSGYLIFVQQNVAAALPGQQDDSRTSCTLLAVTDP